MFTIIVQLTIVNNVNTDARYNARESVGIMREIVPHCCAQAADGQPPYPGVNPAGQACQQSQQPCLAKDVDPVQTFF